MKIMSNSGIKGILGLVTFVFIVLGFIAMGMIMVTIPGMDLFPYSPPLFVGSFIIACILLGVIRMLYLEEKRKELNE